MTQLREKKEIAYEFEICCTRKGEDSMNKSMHFSTSRPRVIVEVVGLTILQSLD